MLAGGPQVRMLTQIPLNHLRKLLPKNHQLSLTLRCPNLCPQPPSSRAWLRHTQQQTVPLTRQRQAVLSPWKQAQLQQTKLMTGRLSMTRSMPEAPRHSHPSLGGALLLRPLASSLLAQS